MQHDGRSAVRRAGNPDARRRGAFWDGQVLWVSDDVYARQREVASDATRWLVDQVVQLAFECLASVATAPEIRPVVWLGFDAKHGPLFVDDLTGMFHLAPDIVERAQAR